MELQDYLVQQLKKLKGGHAHDLELEVRLGVLVGVNGKKQFETNVGLKMQQKVEEFLENEGWMSVLDEKYNQYQDSRMRMRIYEDGKKEVIQKSKMSKKDFLLREDFAVRVALAKEMTMHTTKMKKVHLKKVKLRSYFDNALRVDVTNTLHTVEEKRHWDNRVEIEVVNHLGSRMNETALAKQLVGLLEQMAEL